MKILTISDSHSKHDQIPKEWLIPADVIIHAGDISNMGYLNEIELFCNWFNGLEQYTYKIFCGGNHDFGLAEKPKEVAEILKRYPDIIYLEDSGVEIEGVKIYGSPQTPYFHGWAFNCARNQQDSIRYKKTLIKDYWDKLDNSIDILFTHGPVHGLHDLTPSGEFVGCKDLLDTIVTKLDNCLLHICGHIHMGHGFAYKYGKTFVNASILNERYMLAYKPIIVDFDKETKKAIIIE